MRATHPAGYGAIRGGGGRTARLRAPGWRAGDWLSLAAAPTFATLALLSGSEGDCGAHQVGSMVAMYGLMAVFHLSPWLKLIFDRAGDKT